jgi:hypothetical protein
LLNIYPGGGGFNWDWVPSKGHSGAILMGVKEDKLEVEAWEKGVYFIGATVRHKLRNFRWDMLIVYGPANHDLSPDFLGELSNRCENVVLPIVMGVTLT